MYQSTFGMSLYLLVGDDAKIGGDAVLIAGDDDAVPV